MPTLVLKDVGIWIDGLSYAGVSNAISLEVSADTPEATVFKDEWKTRAEGGLKSAAFSLDGFFDETDAAQFESLGNERSVLAVPNGMLAGDVGLDCSCGCLGSCSERQHRGSVRLRLRGRG